MYLVEYGGGSGENKFEQINVQFQTHTLAELVSDGLFDVFK